MKSTQSGLTVVEVMVSAAILALIALALLSATVPLTDASREQTIAMDMDRQAGKLFAELRREVRQSGRQSNGDDHIFVPDATNTWSPTLTFEMRFGPDEDDWLTGVSYSTSTSSPAMFSGVPAPTPRLKVWRGTNGLARDVIDEVQTLRFRRPVGAPGTLEVELTLLKASPRRNADGSAATPIQRVYRDTIQIMNRAE